MDSAIRPEAIIDALLGLRGVDGLCWCSRGWFTRDANGRVTHVGGTGPHTPSCLATQALLLTALEAID